MAVDLVSFSSLPLPDVWFSLAEFSGAQFDYQVSVVVQGWFRSFELETDVRGPGSGMEDDVVFEVARGAVVDQVDALADRVGSDLGVVRYGFYRAGAEIIICSLLRSDSRL